MFKDTVLSGTRRDGSGNGIVECSGGANGDLPTAAAVGRTDGHDYGALRRRRKGVAQITRATLSLSLCPRRAARIRDCCLLVCL